MGHVLARFARPGQVRREPEWPGNVRKTWSRRPDLNRGPVDYEGTGLVRHDTDLGLRGYRRGVRISEISGGVPVKKLSTRIVRIFGRGAPRRSPVGHGRIGEGHEQYLQGVEVGSHGPILPALGNE